MLGNATNLMNVMVLSNTVTKFFSDPSIRNILMLLLIGVTLLVSYLNIEDRKRSDRYNQLQKRCDDLLQPGKVKLDYNRGGLFFTPSNHPELNMFLREIQRQMKRHKYKGRQLYKKVEKVVNEYNTLRECSDKEMIEIFINRLKKEGLEYVFLDNIRDVVLDDCITILQIPVSIHNKVSGRGTITESQDLDGRYTLLCAGVISKTSSKDKHDKLKELFETMARDDVINGMVRECGEIEKEVNVALESYNDRLSDVIDDLRYCRC